MAEYNPLHDLRGSNMRATEEHDPKNGTGIDRRKFLAALGAAAAAGTILETAGSSALGQNPPVSYFFDSFGDVLPVSQDAINAGCPLPTPPPANLIPPPAQGATAAPHSGGKGPVGGRNEGGRLLPEEAKLRSRDDAGTYCSSYGTTNVTYDVQTDQPNILLIMVDQMRFPRWLTQGQLATVQSTITPYIYGFSQHSYIFTNFHVNSSPCTPSRAAIQTGLYPQQTCMFVNQDGTTAPSLLPYNASWTPDGSHGLPGFPTIGNVLSQSLPNNNFPGVYTKYDCAWIGKWHLSDNGTGGTTGANSAHAYGYKNGYSIPNPPASQGGLYTTLYPSPNGAVNEGNGGEFLDGSNGMTLYQSLAPTFPCEPGHTCPPPYPPPPTPTPGYYQLNDAAIYQAFNKDWLGHPPPEPWFCAVSFVNPHDVSRFPWAYGLAGDSSGDFTFPTTPDENGYLPPPTAGFNDPCSPYPCDGTIIPTKTAVFSTTGQPGLPPVGNRNTDDPSNQSYGPCNGSLTGPAGKPGLQTFFQTDFNNNCGAIQTQSGWVEFLNYYYWMQQCVDSLVGKVISDVTTAQNSGTFTHRVMIVFTSDHGDFAGSHNLHSKGGALYDECTNVPLYVGFRPNTLTAPVVRPFVCSAVDLLPFLYSMALGNEGWRCASANDIIYYLSGRESIRDAMLGASTAKQRRLSSISYTNPLGTQPWQTYQPYVLHTIDQYSAAPGSCAQPSHGIGFRTVDLTINPAPRSGQSSPTPYTPAATYGPFGGGKLGMYSFWNPSGSISGSPCGTWPVLSNSSYPIQFEFYNYNYSTGTYAGTGNFAEIGNDAFGATGGWDPTALAFLCSYNNVMCAELYNTTFPSNFQGQTLLHQQLQAAFALAWQDYLNFVTGGTTSCTAPTGTCPQAVPHPGGTCPT
jgi:arylsulfatase A-like enzyme